MLSNGEFDNSRDRSHQTAHNDNSTVSFVPETRRRGSPLGDTLQPSGHRLRRLMSHRHSRTRKTFRSSVGVSGRRLRSSSCTILPRELSRPRVDGDALLHEPQEQCAATAGPAPVESRTKAIHDLSASGSLSNSHNFLSNVLR
jgi:hypothetical protein